MTNSRTQRPIVLSSLLFLLAAAPILLAQQTTQVAGGMPQVARNTAAAGVNPAVQPMANPMAPTWIPLNPKHQEYVDQVLAYWEYKSNSVKRYRCEFRRWEYDPVWGPQDTFNKYSEGVIKYSAPDKGLFRVEKMKQYQAPQQPGGQPLFPPVAKDQFDHWICDGQWVYYFDHRQKKLVQTQLPPELRGKAIGKGPLPFLFNAKADDIKRRFWLRIITPKDKIDQEYHLEAVPRTQADAANCRMIHVIIDRADYLPKAMIVFDPNFSSKTPSRTTYEFAKREVNFSVLAEKLNLFHREFFEPTAPVGWKKDVRRWNEPVAPATARNPGASDANR